MIDDFATVVDYSPEELHLVRSTCLTVATVLGDLMEESTTIVGGLVPALLIDQENLPEGVEPHPGTADLDLALQLVVLEGERYETMAERLRRAGFGPDRNHRGNLAVQRWRAEVAPGREVRIDFLIPPVENSDPRRIFNLTSGFGAIVTPGLELAFVDRFLQRVEGRTLRGAHLSRDLWVCGPAALVVLKALACRGRDKPKDAFDLYYLIRNYGRGPADVARRFVSLGIGTHPAGAKGLQILREDFARPGGIGPQQVARFHRLPVDDAICDDVVAFVGEFLDQLDRMADEGASD